MRNTRRYLSSLLVLALALQPVITSSGHADGVYDLAGDIDRFEKDLDKWGYVLIKKPDIWGQARFTQHRVEFEETLKGELGNFDVKLQGAASDADSALAAMALSIQAALPGPQAHFIQPYEMLRRFQELKRQDVMDQNYGSTTTTTNVGSTSTQSESATQGSESNIEDLITTDELNSGSESSTDNSTETVVEAPEKKVFPTQLPKREVIGIPTGPTPESLVPGYDVIKRTDQLSYSPKGFGGPTGLGLEPSLILDQHARYLNHLHALRRVNEGDDNADAPGYNLYLVRIPVSINPSKKTEKGYGARVTMSIEPHFGDNFLRDTFRDLVINDVLTQLSSTIWHFARNEKLLKEYEEFRIAGGTKEGQALEQRVRTTSEVAFRRSLSEIANGRVLGSSAPLAFPPSFNDEVFGELNLTNIASLVASAHTISNTSPETLQLAQVRETLRQSLEVAYDLLENEGFKVNEKDKTAWDYCKPDIPLEIAKILTGRKAPDEKIDPNEKRFPIVHRRKAFMKAIGAASEDIPSPEMNLAWGIIVHASFLQERLIEDMSDLIGLVQNEADVESVNRAIVWNEEQAQKPTEQQEDNTYQFFRPKPSGEARHAFEQYVKTKWPTYVFALDPMTEDQNVLNQYSQRREMQIAMAMSLASGWFKGQSLRRYARRLERDMETVALNRTIVGFGYGESTFGWQFYPRFQTPPLENNLTAVVRQTLIGPTSRESLMRTRVMEEGPRECVAIVVMPSFVRNASMDVRSEWFPLGKRKFAQNVVKLDFLRTEGPDLKKALRLSQALNEVEENREDASWSDGNQEFKMEDVRRKRLDAEVALRHAQAKTEPDKIEIEKAWNDLRDAMTEEHRQATVASRVRGIGRDDERQWILRYAGNLEDRLPIQSHAFNVPFDRTVGGLELFDWSAGALAPELEGWYGASHLDLAKGGTLFLVGRHFNTLGTEVLVNGSKTDSTLISRQVLQVTVSAGLKTPNPDEDVEVRVATAYGVSQPLLIPTFSSDKKDNADAKAKTGYAWDESAKPVMNVAFVEDPADAKVGRVASANFERPTVALLKLGRPDDPPNNPDAATVAFSVFAVGADGKETKLGDTSPTKVTFSPGTKVGFLGVQGATKIPNPSEAPMTTVLAPVIEEGLLKSHNAVKIRCKGNLSFDNAGANQDGLPIIAIDNALDINVVTKTDK
ncbi:MAG: hypothetical protein IT365_00940 [Candidatus Hydrogenedentes bacterium]|nr:hypothetical protein [Candidatus Hydrogenedentota bacterium]